MSNIQWEIEDRNMFAGDAINYLFRQGLNCLAHIGGTSHFNMQYRYSEKWYPYPKDYKQHIRDFVKADRVIITDSNTGKIHTLR